MVSHRSLTLLMIGYGLMAAACGDAALAPTVEKPTKPEPKLEIPDTCPKPTAPATTMSGIIPRETYVGPCGDVAFYDMTEGAQLRTVAGDVIKFGSNFARDFDVQGDIVALTTERLPDASAAITDPRNTAWSFRHLRGGEERKAAEFGPAESYGFGYDSVQHASYGLIATPSGTGTRIERWSPKATWPAVEVAASFKVVAHARAGTVVAARTNAADPAALTALLTIDVATGKFRTWPVQISAYDKLWLSEGGQSLLVQRMSGADTLDELAKAVSSKMYRVADAAMTYDFGASEVLAGSMGLPPTPPVERAGTALLPRTIGGAGSAGAYVVDVATAKVTDGGERESLGILANGDAAFASVRADGQGAALVLRPSDGSTREHGAVGAGQLAYALSDDGTVLGSLPEGVAFGSSAALKIWELPSLVGDAKAGRVAHRNVSADNKLFDLWCASGAKSCAFSVSGVAVGEPLPVSTAGLLLGAVGKHAVRAYTATAGGKALSVEVRDAAGKATAQIDSGLMAAAGLAMVKPAHGLERGVLLMGYFESSEVGLVSVPNLSGD